MFSGSENLDLIIVRLIYNLPHSRFEGLLGSGTISDGVPAHVLQDDLTVTVGIMAGVLVGPESTVQGILIHM